MAFIDATALAICHNRRIYSHKVFKKIAKRGKTSVGWFYGFKLHLIINDRGELLAFHLTPGNVDDRRPVPQLTKALSGKLFGDKGAISKRPFQDLFDRGLQLITPIRKNLPNRLLPLFDKCLLRRGSRPVTAAAKRSSPQPTAVESSAPTHRHSFSASRSKAHRTSARQRLSADRFQGR